MKNIIISVIILLISSIFSYSQNIIDPPKIIESSEDTMIIRTQNEFVIGWNWGGRGRELDNALKVNYYHGLDYNDDKTDYCDNPRVMYVLGDMVHSCAYNLPFNGRAMYYDPVLTVDSNINFQPRLYDKTGAILAFSYNSFHKCK